jgi:hypothetical protein
MVVLVFALPLLVNLYFMQVVELVAYIAATGHIMEAVEVEAILP